MFMGMGGFEENEKIHTQNDKLLGDFGLFARVFHCRLRDRRSVYNHIVIFSLYLQARAQYIIVCFYLFF